MPSQASSDATLKVSPNLSVTLLAANLRDFLRGTDQGWLYLEVGFSPYYIGYLHPKFDCCEDQLNETKTALKMPIKDNSLMGIFYSRVTTMSEHLTKILVYCLAAVVALYLFFSGRDRRM